MGPRSRYSGCWSRSRSRSSHGSSPPSCSAKVNKHLGLTADAGQWGSSRRHRGHRRVSSKGTMDVRSPAPACVPVCAPVAAPLLPLCSCCVRNVCAVCSALCTPCTWPSAQSCLHFLRQDIRGMTKHEANKTKAVNSGPAAGAPVAGAAWQRRGRGET